MAVFLSGFDPGGSARQMIELVRRIDRQQFDVHVACFHRRGAWLPRAEEHAASIAEFPIKGFRRAQTFAEARHFARWCRERGIAVVHTSDLHANIFGLPAAAMAGVPVRIGNRSEITVGTSTGQLALQRAAYSCARLVVANSQAAAARLAQERVPVSRVQVVPNGIALEAYAPRPVDRPLRRIVTVATLRPEKGHDTLIAAMPAVLRRCRELEFVFAGDGPCRSQLEGLARTTGVTDRVRFVGHADDVPGLLASSDLFVLPSRSEAFPDTVLEAMAAGLPVIASRIGGITELIDHQRTGVLVPPDDARALSFALLDLVQWPDHAARLGQAARRMVASRYSSEQMVSAFERIYREQLAVHAPAHLSASEMMAS